MILNAYEMMQDVRSSLNEATASHWTDLEILRKLNKAQRKIAIKVSMSGDWFMSKSTITPSSSLITLPTDCVKPIYLEKESDGTELPFHLTVRERQLTRTTEITLDALGPDVYMYGDYIEVNQDSFTGNVVLWYEKRIPDLHFGTGGSSSGVSALHFQATNIPVPRDDYYNGVYISIISGTGALTRAAISDYVGSTGVATVAGTFGSNSIYGTETQLPQEAIPLLTLMATSELLAKPSAAIDPKYWEYLKMEMKDAMSDLEGFLSTRLKNSVRIRPQDAWL